MLWGRQRKWHGEIRTSPLGRGSSFSASCRLFRCPAVQESLYRVRRSVQGQEEFRSRKSPWQIRTSESAELCSRIPAPSSCKRTEAYPTRAALRAYPLQIQRRHAGFDAEVRHPAARNQRMRSLRLPNRRFRRTVSLVPLHRAKHHLSSLTFAAFSQGMSIDRAGPRNPLSWVGLAPSGPSGCRMLC